jgi:hypothetical protein
MIVSLGDARSDAPCPMRGRLQIDFLMTFREAGLAQRQNASIGVKALRGKAMLQAG